MREHEQSVIGLSKVRKGRKPSLINTALLTSAWYIGTDLLYGELERHTPIRTGSGMSDEELKEAFSNSRLYLLQSVVAAPVLEETVFRKLPHKLLKQKAENPLSAVATSAIFAGIHNVKTDGKVGYETKKMPLYQFADGLLYWYLSKKRGILHSMIAHAITNTLVFAQHHLNEKIRRKK